MYRKRALQVILLLFLLAPWTVWPQKKPARSGPRATALVVLAPDGKTAARLIPVCIRDNDRFWDASIYQASPRPMALEPGTVYEIERTGTSIGLFTVAQPVQENGAWIALGSWQPPRPKTAMTSPTSDEDRPVLRRAPPPAASAPEKPTAEPPAAPPPPPVDTERPILTRSKPTPGSQPAAPSVPADTASAQKPAPPKAKSKPPELVPAISDADGPEPHPFTLMRNADEESNLRKAASALVEEAVLKQAGLAPSAARVDFKESSLKYFDLDGNNSAELVLTARVALYPQSPPPATRRAPPRRPPNHPPSVALREFEVTFIAREDLSGELHTSFTRITDVRNLHLDGRFELIDAVDVDGDSRGELLFRRLIGQDVSYVVLKVGLSQTTKLFDSAGE